MAPRRGAHLRASPHPCVCASSHPCWAAAPQRLHLEGTRGPRSGLGLGLGYRVRRKHPAGSRAPGSGRRAGAMRQEAGAPSPWSSSVQGSAVFRLPSDLTPGPQRPPGCAAMAQLSSRCQINEPTSGWVYSPASQAAEWKRSLGQLARLLHARVERLLSFVSPPPPPRHPQRWPVLGTQES